MKRWTWAVLACVALGIMAWWLTGNDTPVEVAPTPVIQVPTPKTTRQSPQVAEQQAPALHVAVAATPPLRQPSPSPPNVGSYLDWVREVVASLSSRMQDADALLTAAMIVNVFESAQPAEIRHVEQLLVDAHRQAPLDAVVAATAFRICSSRTGCDALPYEKTLQSVDGNNELGHIGQALNVAKSGSRKQLTQTLNELRYKRLRMYSGEVGARAWRAISVAATSPLNSPPMAELPGLQNALALKVITAIPPPAYDLFIEKCQTNDWDLARACDQLANNLRRAELIDLQLIGLSIKRSAASARYGGPVPAIEDEQSLKWLKSKMSELPPTPQQWLGLMQSFETEFAASRAWLEQNQVKVPRSSRSLE